MSPRRRRSRSERPGPAGFLVVDKPRGWTYDGPQETVDTTGDPAAELAERQDRIQRELKR